MCLDEMKDMEVGEAFEALNSASIKFSFVELKGLGLQTPLNGL